MFGKRKTPPDKARQGAAVAGTGSGGSSDGIQFPWTDDPAAIACNLACGSLGQSLMNWMKQDDGRVHGETCVAVAGAIAGYAAQRSLIAQGLQLNLVATRTGAEYLFGDALNAMLVPAAGVDPNGFVWSHAAGSAVGSGVPESNLPNLEAMFAHVAKSLGGPLEGRPSTGEGHQPAAPVRELLKTFWPQAEKVLTADIGSETHARFGPAPQRWWGAIAAYPAGRAVTDVKEVLAPAIALTIVMESAIYASKVAKI